MSCDIAAEGGWRGAELEVEGRGKEGGGKNGGMG